MSSEKGEDSPIKEFAADCEIGVGYKPVKLTRSRTIASFVSSECSFDKDAFLTDKTKEDGILSEKFGLRLKEADNIRLTCSENNLANMSTDHSDRNLQWPSMYKLRKWKAMSNGDIRAVVVRRKSLAKLLQNDFEASSGSNESEYQRELGSSDGGDGEHRDFGQPFNCFDICRDNEANEAFANFIEMMPQQPAQPKNNKRYSLRVLREIYYTNKNGIIYNSEMPIPYSIYGCHSTDHKVIRYTIAELHAMDKGRKSANLH